MSIFSVVSDFILSLWLFSITYNWFDLVINTFVLCIGLRFIVHMPMTRSVLVSFSAHFFSFMLFTMMGIGSLSYALFSGSGVLCEVTESSVVTDDLGLACFGLAVLY